MQAGYRQPGRGQPRPLGRSLPRHPPPPRPRAVRPHHLVTIYLLSVFSILCLSAASRSFAIKPFNFLLVCNVVLGLGIRRVAYLQWLHTLTLFAAQSAVLHTAPCLHTFCTFLHCRAQLQTACILGGGTRGSCGLINRYTYTQYTLTHRSAQNAEHYPPIIPTQWVHHEWSASVGLSRLL